MWNRRSRFLKFIKRYEELICGSDSKTFLLNTLFKILSRFLRKCKKKVVQRPRGHYIHGENFFHELDSYGYQKICLFA
jgi:hypothetical protein